MNITQISGRGIPLVGNDIDTDRIIPARYLKEITFEQLGKYAFYDERFDKEGAEKDHPLNDKKFVGGSIMIVNKNFGCGSSREHAPQSLKRFGINAIIGESFAEIFEGNSTTLGIPLVVGAQEDIENLQAVIAEDPALEITIDVENGTVSYGDFSFSVTAKESSRNALVSGKWDSLGVLLENMDEVKNTAEKLPYVNNFENGNC